MSAADQPGRRRHVSRPDSPAAPRVPSAGPRPAGPRAAALNRNSGFKKRIRNSGNFNIWRWRHSARRRRSTPAWYARSPRSSWRQLAANIKPGAGSAPAGVGSRPPATAGSTPTTPNDPERFRSTAPLAPRPHRRWQGGRDRGSVSLWVIIFAFTTLALLILVVDGGQAMNAKSRAADIAEQAARAAADDINVTGLRGGTVAFGGNACDLQNGPAAQLVANYASGVPGATATLTACTSSVTTVGGAPSLSVTATVRLSVRPSLPVPPFNTINATAQETAYLACGSADHREAC